MNGTHIDLSEIVTHFDSLDDPRSTINRKHPLVSVVVIALMAVLAGADGPAAIRAWAISKKELLLGALDLPHGIPSRDVFRRVLMAINPQAFQACFVAWLDSLRLKANGGESDGLKPTFAIDGKTMRGSHNRSKGLGALHLVSVWMTEAGITLGQVATEEKSNEITAIPQLLTLVDIEGAVITIDAMGTQTAIAGQIIDSGGDYVLALKGNQSTTQEEVVEYVDDHMQDDFARVNVQRHVETSQGHGRTETRTYIQLPAPKELKAKKRWKGLRTIGVVIYRHVSNGEEKFEVRYYISSLPLGVKQFARSVRNHWGIENTCHWSLDVTYREDAQRTRNRHLAENLAWLRRFTLSLLKQHPGKDSLVMKRRKCGWNDDFLMEVLTSQTT